MLEKQVSTFTVRLTFLVQELWGLWGYSWSMKNNSTKITKKWAAERNNPIKAYLPQSLKKHMPAQNSTTPNKTISPPTFKTDKLCPSKGGQKPSSCQAQLHKEETIPKVSARQRKRSLFFSSSHKNKGYNSGRLNNSKNSYRRNWWIGKGVLLRLYI